MEGYLCFGTISTLFVISISIWVIQAIERARAKAAYEQSLAKAKAAYEQSLAELKADPTNADLRQRTLHLGRVYANLTRNREGVAIFDEVAMMNDINAACAGAATLRNAAAQIAAARSVEVRLARLAALRAKGLIDEAEYRAKRQKILDEV